MKPCDCKDFYDAKSLDCAGLRFNEMSIEIQPLSVILTNGPATLRIPMAKFKLFAEWYLGLGQDGR